MEHYLLAEMDQKQSLVQRIKEIADKIDQLLQNKIPSVNWQLIMINDMVMDKLSSEDKQSIIAHELAHVYLEHDGFEKDKDIEQEANDLIRSWGFKPYISNKHSDTK
jgi:predicted SprT family Zn-dependent metalloprotease